MEKTTRFPKKKTSKKIITQLQEWDNELMNMAYVRMKQCKKYELDPCTTLKRTGIWFFKKKNINYFLK